MFFPPCWSVSQEIIEVESENVFKLAANALQVGVFQYTAHTLFAACQILSEHVI